jgi:aldose 1-epimerase
MSYETVTITSAGGRTEASFVPDANLVCCSLRDEQVELLDLRRGLETYATAGKTMGIPLLYPWANRLDHFGYAAAGKQVTLSEDDPRIPHDSQGLPIHGVLPRLLQWELIDHSARDALEARLAWTSPELLELFPFGHEVRVRASVSDGELTVATQVHAAEDDPVPVSFGYHPYLRVPGAPRSTWDVELGASRRLVLDERSIPTGEREPVHERRVKLGQSSWDDAFADLATPPRFTVLAGEGQLSVAFDAGYDFAQVFAPAEQEFICFEPMTATSDALNTGDGLRVLAPGEQHRAQFTVTNRRPG